MGRNADIGISARSILKFCGYFPYTAKLCIFSELFKITKVGVARLS